MSNTDLRASLTVTADASALVAEMRKGSEGLRQIRRDAEAAAAAAALAASEQGRMAEKLSRTFSGFGAGQKSAQDSAGVFTANLDQQTLQRERADQAARAYRAIEESLNPLIRAERDLAEAQAVVNRALAEGQTSQEAAARTLQQLQGRHDSFVRAQSPAAQSAKAFEIAIEAEADAMRQLTLALDPAARAQAEFERVQSQVTRAVGMGIVTQDEANRTMQLLAARQKAVGGGFAGMGMGIQNASYQIADFAVQVQAGQAASLALAQQLPQLVGGFGVWGAVAGAAIAIGAPLITMWLNSGEAAGSLDKRLQKLDVSLESVRERLKLLNDHKLDETFGGMSSDIREMTSALVALDRAAELKNLQSSLNKLFKDAIDPRWWQAPTKTQLDTGNFNQNDFRRENYDKLTGGRGPSYDEFATRRAELDALAKAGDREGAVKAISSLVQDFAGGGPVTEINEDLREMLATMAEVAQKTAEVEALFNGAGKASAITRQIDDMVRASEQQAELSRTIIKFGDDSAEVEALRTRQAREALDVKLREMNVVKGSADETRAIAALEGDLTASVALRTQERQKESDALVADLSRQGQLSSAILKFGKDSVEVEALRARHAREVNDERLKEMGLAPNLLAMAQKLFAVEQERARQIRDGEANRKADQMVTGLREQADINRAIALYGRDSLQVKELQIAAERRAYEESLKTLDVSAERKRQLMIEWEQTKGLTSADPFGQVAAAREMDRSQRERMQQLKLEQALLGQSEVTRARILALWKAELEIRRQGLDATSARASEIRAAAAEEAELTRVVERQQAAWSSVQSAAENAIDGIVDKLMGGDWEGALEALASDIGGMLTELSITNPLKNAILGKDLGTMADVGGLSGIWGRLTGRGDGSDVALPEAVTDVGAMNVQAASVVIGGPGAMSLRAGAPDAANADVAPGSFSGLGGASSVQSQIWQFFSGKGLAPHQIAGIMGNVAGESNFNPLAQGDHTNGVARAFGLFQHNDRKGKLFDFIGGQQNLGDVQKQLEFAWHELMTSENGAFKRLMASSDVQGATDAWMRGFERPSERAMVDSWGTRLGAANEALAKFGSTTQTAAIDLGALGNGMGVFGQALSGFAQGGGQGALSGLLGGLGTIIAGAMGIPGFASGGDFGGGLRIVGEKGPELEFTGPSRVMNAELTRQLLSSRAPANTTAVPVDARPVIQIVNNSSAQVTGEVQESTDTQGRRQYQLVMSDAVAQGLAAPGGQAGRVMRNNYGVQRPARVRP